MARKAADFTEKTCKEYRRTKTVMFHVKQFLIHNSEFRSLLHSSFLIPQKRFY